jgi:hypothetical protein
VEDLPNNYNTYFESSGSFSGGSLLPTFLAFTVLSSDLSTTCGRSTNLYVNPPLLGQYYFEYQRFSNVKIIFDNFQDCSVVPDKKMINAWNLQNAYLGVEYNPNYSDRLNLQKLSTGMILDGIALKVGTSNIVIKG